MSKSQIWQEAADRSKSTHSQPARLLLVIVAANHRRRITTPYLYSGERGTWKIEQPFYNGEPVSAVYRLCVKNEDGRIRWEKNFINSQEAVCAADKIELAADESVRIQNMVNFYYIYIRREN